MQRTMGNAVAVERNGKVSAAAALVNLKVINILCYFSRMTKIAKNGKHNHP